MSDLAWAGGSLITQGRGAAAKTIEIIGNAGSTIQVADPPTPLLSFTGAANVNPKALWHKQPSLRKVVGFAARNVAAVPLHVYKRESDTDRKRDAQGPAESLLRQPAPFVTGPSLLHDIVVDWMLYDRWLLLLIEGQLKRIPGKFIKVESDFLGQVTSIGVTTPKGVIDVTDLPLAFDSGWNDDDAAGASPLSPLSATLEEQKRAVQWRAEQWDQSARITGVLTAPKTLAKPNRDRLVQSWRAYTASKAGGTPILENGVDFKQITQNGPVDSNDLEGRRLTDVEVASFYHIPPELVGARQGTFSNIAAFRQMLYGPTLGPILGRIEAALNSQIIPALSAADTYVEFNREAALAGSFAEQAAFLQKAVGGPYMTRAEARGTMNLPHLEGTDELIVPMNVTEGGLASPADTAPTSSSLGQPEWGGNP